jgi:hypothetical protein
MGITQNLENRIDRMCEPALPEAANLNIRIFQATNIQCCPISQADTARL